MALLLLGVKALFFFADNGYRDPGLGGPIVCSSGAGVRLLPLPRDRGPRELTRGGRRDRRRRVHELLLVAAVPGRRADPRPDDHRWRRRRGGLWRDPAQADDPGHGMTRRAAALAALAIIGLLAAGCGTTAPTPAGDPGDFMDVPGIGPTRIDVPAPERRRQRAVRRRSAPAVERRDDGRARGGPARRRPVRRPRGRQRRRPGRRDRPEDRRRCGARTCRPTIRCATSPSPSRTRPGCCGSTWRPTSPRATRSTSRPSSSSRGSASARSSRPGSARPGPPRRGRSPVGFDLRRRAPRAPAGLPRGLDRPGHPRRHQRAHRRQRPALRAVPGVRPVGGRARPHRRRAPGPRSARLVLRVAPGMTTPRRSPGRSMTAET